MDTDTDYRTRQYHTPETPKVNLLRSYRFYRKQGYSPRYAYIAVLSRYTRSDVYWPRMQKISRFLNKLEKEK